MTDKDCSDAYISGGRKTAPVSQLFSPLLAAQLSRRLGDDLPRWEPVGRPIMYQRGELLLGIHGAVGGENPDVTSLGFSHD